MARAPHLPARPAARPGRCPGTTLSLASAGSTRNYYHCLMDSLPRWAMFREAMPDVRPDRIVISHQTRWARELVHLAGIDEHLLVEPVKHLSLRAERLVVPSLPNPRNLAPPWITEWLRTHLRPTTSTGLPKRMYVTRGNARNTRRLVHEAALLPHLERLGFSLFDPGRFPCRSRSTTSLLPRSSWRPTVLDSST